MRRESSTVVVLVGEVGEGLLAGLGRSGNVSLARAPAAGPPAAEEAPAAVNRSRKAPLAHYLRPEVSLPEPQAALGRPRRAAKLQGVRDCSRDLAAAGARFSRVSVSYRMFPTIRS